MSNTSSDREVQVTRAQMELARLLDIPFVSDYQSRDRAANDGTGYLIPGLPDATGMVTVEVRLPADTLLALVAAARNTPPSGP